MINQARTLASSSSSTLNSTVTITINVSTVVASVVLSTGVTCARSGSRAGTAVGTGVVLFLKMSGLPRAERLSSGCGSGQARVSLSLFKTLQHVRQLRLYD